MSAGAENAADRRWLLGAVFQKLIEEFYGCPIDGIRAAEIERWVKDRCKDQDGRLIQREVDAVMDVLR